MLEVIENQKLSTILKVMKYSIQPAVVHESLEDFLESFDNLDFLSFNNWTRYSRTKRFHLTEVNLNPMVYSCNYAQREKSLNNNCTLFHHSLTNDGMGYTFNNANFRDMYSTTSYMDLFSKIMRPKEYKRTRVEQIDKDGLTYPKGIEFTQGSGPTSGLEVHNLFQFLALINSKYIQLYHFRFIWKGTRYMTPEKNVTNHTIHLE